MSYKSGGVNTTSQFHLNTEIPLDSRFVIANKEEYQALLNETGKYEGLQFAVTSDLTLDDGTVIKAGFYRVGLDKKTISDVDEYPGFAYYSAEAEKASGYIGGGQIDRKLKAQEEQINFLLDALARVASTAANIDGVKVDIYEQFYIIINEIRSKINS